MMTLNRVKVGERVRVVGVSGLSARKLKEAGFLDGTPIKVMEKKALGGMLIFMRGSTMKLSNGAAKSIRVTDY